MKVERFKIFEAELRDNSAMPQSYLDNVEKIAKEVYGTSGPNHNEMMRAGFLFHNIMQIQYGKESKLSEIAKEIIMEEYGEILDGVELDIKLVRPGDSEQMMMVKKLQQSPKNEAVEYDEINEIDKAKVLQNILQGEAQNVQNMMYYKKDEIDKINPNYLDYLVEFFKINKKFDWKNGISMGAAIADRPEMANMVDIDYKKPGEKGYFERGEEGQSQSQSQSQSQAQAQAQGQSEEIPVIIVRALDLQMLIHETVKGVYKLIMAHAIPPDAEIAAKIKNAVSTLDDETQDVKYGPYIAADIRDYLMGLIDRKYENQVKDIKHIKEFVYSKMAQLRADIFIDLIYFILDKNMNKADYIMKQNRIIETIIEEINGEPEEFEDSYTGNGNYLQKDDEFDETGYADGDEDEPREVQTWKQYNNDVVSGPVEHIKKIKNMDDEELYSYLKTKTSPADRVKIIDQGLDDGDYDVVKRVNEFIVKNGR